LEGKGKIKANHIPTGGIERGKAKQGSSERGNEKSVLHRHRGESTPLSLKGLQWRLHHKLEEEDLEHAEEMQIYEERTSKENTYEEKIEKRGERSGRSLLQFRGLVPDRADLKQKILIKRRKDYKESTGRGTFTLVRKGHTCLLGEESNPRLRGEMTAKDSAD